jgi:hypothetical protein
LCPARMAVPSTKCCAWYALLVRCRYMNFCPGAVPNTTSSSRYPVAISTAVHELMHVLGFNADSWPLFRDGAGAPLTPRDPVLPNQVSVNYKV